MWKICVLALALAAPLPAAASQERYICIPDNETAAVPAILALQYRDARKALIANGWKPMLEDHPYTTAGEEWALKEGFEEYEFCAGTGAGRCYFNFRDAGGSVLHVITGYGRGEYDFVERFFFLCESDAPLPLNLKYRLGIS